MCLCLLNDQRCTSLMYMPSQHDDNWFGVPGREEGGRREGGKEGMREGGREEGREGVCYIQCLLRSMSWDHKEVEMSKV